ncbi:hypothetical protein MSAS_33960 [Mycobacterium saskatchewanense]|uniref:DUF4226 domain-containing protein n=1 Tax=Mycobacterium saskatchewanense TaxID=220927 RepID=A0AAJ3NM90_9MYCO|nr:DUF4226 domain-containing protein [Mycobacterium saskatchewanense]ORW68538.1 hypothetical protein AWC23_20970 [Mycobacterium saskatchewanense]BBX64222.1 hypothetical protein MSAS_33960 [Mycobacterium saskatchewanense]
MSVHDELLAAVASIRDRTGDANAWQAGLTPDEVTAVVNPATGSERLAAILSKIRAQHPELFGAPATGGPPGGLPPQPVPDGARGDAAEAIWRAEAALAQQNSVTSQLDMQVITAILNAHLKSVEGREELTKLQRETEDAVQTRSDLDTPAGARDFQRFLIGKLRDIRAVVLNASLDDTSKSALMAAWTSLYDASRDKPEAGEQRASSAPAEPSAPDDLDPGGDPLLDPLVSGDPDPGTRDAPAPGAPAPTPTMPAGFGAGPLPGLGTAGGPGLGLPLPALPDGTRTDPIRRKSDDDAVPEPGDRDPSDESDDPEAMDKQAGDPPAAPTAISLPDGETVTVANPQLAAAIKAAVGGVPIADAFRQQGITIPPPGTTVTDPIDPQRLAPGDIGIFTDRHALALSPGKALLDGQIQHIATVNGPSFLGWEHPPVVTATGAAPANPDTPAPTRPASAPTTAQ